MRFLQAEADQTFPKFCFLYQEEKKRALLEKELAFVNARRRSLGNIR